MAIDRDRLAAMAAEPHFHKGRYRNIEKVQSHGLGDFLKWQLAPGKRFPPGKRYPLLKPDAATLNQPADAPQLTWLGHASFLFQYRGLNVLTDPVLSERASPFRFIGPKRYTPPALTVSQMPEIHLVLISHNHYDHLDEQVVRQLHKRFGDKLRFCVPTGLKSWFGKRGIQNVVELGWWQAERLSDHEEVFCLPTQHFSGRGTHDGNTSLWCSWLLDIEGFRLYFGGDTGYGKVFDQIGQLFTPIDLALLPIGAYNPRWFMSPVHVDPEEAVRIHQDIGAVQSVAMHWGTFVLTDEAMDEPPRRLRQALNDQKLDPGSFIVMQHGEIRSFARNV